MFWLAAAALAALPPHSTAGAPVEAAVQARATVRILSGVRLRLDGSTNIDAPTARPAVIRSNGTAQPAMLVQFE